LQAQHYSAAQMDGALGSVFGVDRQLIRDGTYFVVEHRLRPPPEPRGAGRRRIGWLWRLEQNEKRFSERSSDASGQCGTRAGERSRTKSARFSFIRLGRGKESPGDSEEVRDAICAAGFIPPNWRPRLPGIPFYAAHHLHLRRTKRSPVA